MIDDRRAAILQAVVQQYIETSQPVSSSTVVGAGAVRASPATVRSEMAALEREGYLQQPHTSAGRIPTDRGYRYFVDRLDVPGRLGPTQQHDVKSFFAKASGEIEGMLNETGRLLSNLTGAAALVVGPDHETNIIRSAQIVSLGPRNALVVVVASDGSVDKCAIEVPPDVSEVSVAAASTRLAQHINGRSLQTSGPLPPSGNVAVDALATKALDLLMGQSNDDTDVYVGGASRLASAFDAVETVRNVLSILEQQYVVVTLIRDLLDRGVSVSIGTEHADYSPKTMQPLAHCSLIVAPTLVDGEPHGSIAILGPTRMDYAQALSAVSVVSKQLGERLGDS